MSSCSQHRKQRAIVDIAHLRDLRKISKMFSSDKWVCALIHQLWGCSFFQFISNRALSLCDTECFQQLNTSDLFEPRPKTSSYWLSVNFWTLWPHTKLRFCECVGWRVLSPTHWCMGYYICFVLCWLHKYTSERYKEKMLFQMLLCCTPASCWSTGFTFVSKIKIFWRVHFLKLWTNSVTEGDARKTDAQLLPLVVGT